MNPYRIVSDFEQALCEYTGASLACAVNSCTAALQLCCEWICNGGEVSIPKHTYVSVPCAIIQAGCGVVFRDEEWRGAYQLTPLPIWDCARRFTSGMYVKGQFQCVSFAASKILGIEQGGAILHNDPKAQTWFQAMKFDGRMPGTMPSGETVIGIGHHCLMTPSVAAQALLRLHHLPKHNEDLPDYPYPDLSTFEVFR
ncbi:MAG: DegT/DnrJ/EryC1/StrS family aminotransferase [Parcubacteria group bacterium]